MNKQQQLEKRLTEHYQPSYLQVINESHMHSSGRGADSHFKVIMVSDKFIGMRAVARHREIYQLLADELNTGIHALALHLYTESEWQQNNQQAPHSPNCLGVGQ